jgi:hypothetical protein
MPGDSFNLEIQESRLPRFYDNTFRLMPLSTILLSYQTQAEQMFSTAGPKKNLK